MSFRFSENGAIPPQVLEKQGLHHPQAQAKGLWIQIVTSNRGSACDGSRQGLRFMGLRLPLRAGNLSRYPVSSANAEASRSQTSVRSQRSRWRNNRIVGYQGLCSARAPHLQSGMKEIR